MKMSKCGIDKSEWSEILEVFMPSAEMREYLLNEEISKYRLAQLICGSPVPLYIKLEWVTRLSLKEPYGEEDPELFTCIRQDISDALHFLEVHDGEFLYLKSNWFDYDLMDENTDNGEAPFQNLYSAQSWILRDLADMSCFDHEKEFEEEIAAEDTFWYTLEKWIKTSDNQYVKMFTYYLFKDEIVYFENESLAWHEHYEDYTHFAPDNCWIPENYWNSQNLNLPVPFKTGDVVVIDCTPFKPATLAKITDVGDNRDCCSLQALARCEDGSWREGAVKHGHIFLHGLCYMSPLYRIKKYEGVIPEQYSRLTD